MGGRGLDRCRLQDGRKSSQLESMRTGLTVHAPESWSRKITFVLVHHIQANLVHHALVL